MSAPIARGFSSLFAQLKNGARGLIPLVILIVFTIIGAFIFRELESPNEIYTLKTLEKERRDLVENTVFRLNNIRGMRPQQAYNHTVKTLERFQEKLGVEPVDPELQQKWTFWGAMFYCLTVYTTIGYGSIFPVTAGGRIFTCLYAFLGIPLTLICLYYLGLIFARACKIIWKYFIKSFGCFSKDLERRMSKAVGLEEGKAKGSSEEEEADELLSFPISFLAFVSIVWILICAAIFALNEDWDYGTSLYFTLISFTTVGFGDIVPNESGVILFGLLLFIGLALVSTVLNLIQQQIEALATGMQDNIDREYMNALAEAADEGEISEKDLQHMAEGAPEGGEEAPHPAVEEQNKRALDAVIARMPLRERLLFKCMPSGTAKRLEKSAQQKAGRKTRACQTDNTLLEALIKEEILKMELNNELERRRPRTGLESPFLTRKAALDAFNGKIRDPEEEEEEEKQEEGEPVAPMRPHRGFKIEKVTEVEKDEDKPVISTTVLQEDDV